MKLEPLPRVTVLGVLLGVALLLSGRSLTTFAEPYATANTSTPAAAANALETITVPTNGSSVTSKTVLQAGVSYQIQAFGTFISDTSSGRSGDAEYAFDNAGTVLDLCRYSLIDLGIGINDTVNDERKFPMWGAYTPSHVYTINFTGLGAPISLNYHDCNYTDNSGTLTVQITRGQNVYLPIVRR